MKKHILLKALFSSIILFAFIQPIIAQRSCPSDYSKPYTWPTHSKWLFGDGNILDFGASGTNAPVVTTVPPAQYISSYESATSVANNAGNLLFLSNGVSMWDATGNFVGGGNASLLTGAEINGGNDGSAVQGIITVRHPLDTNNYYIFTTDDAIAGENGITRGFNYYVYNAPTNTLSGPTRLGNFRSTEQVAATWHANGIDIWISTHTSPSAVGGPTSTTFHSYLLTCSGLNTNPAVSNAGFIVSANAGGGGRSNERASLNFSWDGTKAVATHHNGSGTWDPAGAVSILDFDNSTGFFSGANPVNVNDAPHSTPYSSEWAPDNNSVYITYLACWGAANEIGKINANTGVYTRVAGMGAGIQGGIKLGGDGRMYTGRFSECPYGATNSLGVLSGDLNGGIPVFNGNGVPAPNNVKFSLPNMFIPPRDWVEITAPPALTTCDLPYDFSATWFCKGTSAENTPLYENAWSVDPSCVGCTIDPVTGIFNAPSDGQYTIYFGICDIRDTLTFNVGVCGCEADVKNVDYAICAGENIMLDSLFIKSSEVGEWVIDSTPVGATAPATITNGTDTIFNSTINNTPGKYKVIYSVNNKQCYDSLYITVKPLPIASIDPLGPLCSDSIATNMVGSPIIANDTNGIWLINNNIKLTNVFDPVNDNDIITGINKVIYAVELNGCVDTARIDVEVKDRVVVSVDSLGAFCASDPAVIYTATPSSGTWFISDAKNIGANGSFSPSNVGAGNYEIWHKIGGQCGASDTVGVIVNPNKDASIATPDTKLCKDDASLNLAAIFPGGTWYVTDTSRVDSILAGGVFNPVNYAPGDYNVYYVQPDPCGDIDTVIITVIERVVIEIDSLNPFCANDPQVNYTATPDTGVWSISNGKVIGANGEFNPATVGPGTYKIYHTVNSQCGASDSVIAIVNPIKNANITTPDSTVCKDDPAVVLSADSTNGRWFVTDTSNANLLIAGTFDPANYAAGVYDIIHKLNGPCGDLDTIKITIIDRADASFVAPKTVYCAQDDSVRFIPTNAGGTWSGAGINANTGWFNPANGTQNSTPYKIYYTIDGRCGHIDSVEVTVNPNKDATITNYPAANDSLITCVFDPNPTFSVVSAGGTWNNPAVIANGTNMEIDLDILTNNKANMVNDLLLIYTQANPCEDKDSVWITTTAQLDATINQPAPVCDDVDSVQITRPNSANGVWSADCGACINSSTGMFYPKIASDGTHRITYTISGNCGDVQFVDIVVNRTPDPTITSNNGDTIKLCIDEPIVNLTTAEANGTWRAIGNDNGGLNANNATFDPSVSEDGTFRLEYAFAGACPAKDTIVIKIDPLPVIVFDFDTIYCDNETALNLTVTPTGGIWSGDGITNVNLGTFNPAIANKGTNTVPAINNVQYDVTVGLCSATKTQIINIIEQPDATIDPIGILCNVDTAVNLTAADPNGTWSGVGVTDVVNGVFNPNGLAEGIYEVEYTINGYCSATDKINIDVRNPKDPTIIPQPAICIGEKESVTFTANNAGTWSGDVNSAGVLNITDSGKYQIINTITDVCIIRDTIEFIVKHAPPVEFEGTIINGCIGFTETFRDLTDTVGAGPIVTSLWDFGNGLTSSNRLSATSPYNNAGTFTVSLTNTYANGCSRSDTIFDYITANPFPIADFNWEPSLPSVLDNVVRFNNLSQGGAAGGNLWEFESRSGIPNNSDFEPTVILPSTDADTIAVTLTVTSIDGCKDTITKNIPIQDFFNIFIPNAFTPTDGNGLNDTFYPKGRNIISDDYHFMIFNRWGQLIWDTHEPGVGWDGRVENGLSQNVQQIDTYVWKLIVRNQFEGKTIEMVGIVNLIN